MALRNHTGFPVIQRAGTREERKGPAPNAPTGQSSDEAWDLPPDWGITMVWEPLGTEEESI